MAEDAQSRVQRAVKDFVNAIDRSHLRKMERGMHECAANCCSNESGTMEEVRDQIEDIFGGICIEKVPQSGHSQVHGCVERCQQPTARAQRFIQTEIERFQESLSRCIMQCQEDVKDKVTPSTSEAEVSKLRQE